MSRFSWTDDLYTGNALIDGDHRKLVDLVNVLFESLQSEAGDGRMPEAMHDLIAFAGEHFAREEAVMTRIEYVAARAHRAEHTKLLKQLVELKAMLDAGGKINSPAVADFLGAWLRNHILTTDMKLAATLRQQPDSAPGAQPH